MIPVRRAVQRETGADYQGRPIVVRLEPGGRLLRIKLKGQRVWYTVTIAQVYQLGARNKAEEERREKARLREERRQENRRLERVLGKRTRRTTRRSPTESEA